MLNNENRELKNEKEMLLNDAQQVREMSEEIQNLKEINERKEKENAALYEENQRLDENNEQHEKKLKKYENYLSSLKEKPCDIKFFGFDDYKEESIIGENKTSSVKIVHKVEKEKYAMKELVQFDHKSMQRFLGEGEILFKLRHPCIIRVYCFNFGDETHKPSMILSLEPKSLETAIENKELDNVQKNRITVELVLGMRYIHKHKIMHRNLKPLNILLSKNNHVRITDFGLAKEDDPKISQTIGVGSLHFMAPELSEENEESYTNKVDVYSFGITLIYIVSDKYPPNTLGKSINTQLSNDISKWVRELIDRCLSFEPKNRPTFDEIFIIMKENNFDLFSDSKDQKLTSKQQRMKKHIESRITKIEAFEFQHQ